MTLLGALRVRIHKGAIHYDPASFRSAWQTVMVGGLAATAAFVIAKAMV